jgi:hypothetical protein
VEQPIYDRYPLLRPLRGTVNLAKRLVKVA